MAMKRSINDIIPEDVIREIFLHCIPSNPLEFRQPNVTIAPILVCHVCSHWRDIAFRSPRIWAHLYYVARYLQNPARTLDNRDLTFLKWWHDKVKDVPPSLRLEFRQDVGGTKNGYQAINIDKFLKSFVRFIHNARYLNLDLGYNLLLRTLVSDSQQPLSCPNLDTLILRRTYGPHLRTRRTIFFENPLVPVTPEQSLRRLLIESIPMEAEDVVSNINFSIITHLHLSLTSATLEIWFSLLQQSVNLIYGSFNITFDGDLEGSNSLSQPIILPHLRQMAFENLGGELHQSFIDGLQLPSLFALRINHWPPLNVDRLHRILSSTPGLQTLQLGESFADNEQPGSPNFIFIEGDLVPTQTPISNIVPHLSSIHFKYGYTSTNIFTPENRNFVISVLTGDWLQVGRPGNCISRIQLSSPSPILTEESINTLIRDIQSDLPAGLDFSARPSDLPDPFLSWGSQHTDFTDEFEDMMLDGI